MTRKISPFTPVQGLDGVYIARAGKLNCFALRLRDGGLCLYSPVSGLSADTRDQLESLGGVRALLAPNHYHNKGVQEFADAFPGASLSCTPAATARLQQITGLRFQPVSMLDAQLPDGHRLLEPDGLKTGEVWVQIKGPLTGLIVTDAFSASLHPFGEWAVTPTLLSTFPTYGVRNAAQFKASALHLLESVNPTILLSCHGSPVRAENLHDQLTDLLSGQF